MIESSIGEVSVYCCNDEILIEATSPAWCEFSQFITSVDSDASVMTEIHNNAAYGPALSGIIFRLDPELHGKLRLRVIDEKLHVFGDTDAFAVFARNCSFLNDESLDSHFHIHLDHLEGIGDLKDNQYALVLGIRSNDIAGR